MKRNVWTNLGWSQWKWEEEPEPRILETSKGLSDWSDI